MGEPIAVAFVEIVPETAAFKAATEAQVRSQLAATSFAVPAPNTAAASGQLQKLAAAANETRTAETLLAEATAAYNEALAAGQGLQGAAAQAHVRKAAAAGADAAAQEALFAITNETNAATVAEIDALVTATGTLNAKAAAEERAAFATETHTAASTHVTEALLAEAGAFTGLRGASLGLNPTFLAATAGAIAFFKSVELAGDFQEQMHQIEFATHATGDQLETAAKQAENFGRANDIFQASSVDSITVIRELTESGQTLNEAYAETPAVLNLATAAELDHADAVRTTIQLLDAYNLTADQATEVTDSISAAGKLAAGSNEEFANSLRVAAPVANAFGLSIRDTTTLLVQMVQGGVSASQAGSLLRQSLLRLTNASPAAVKALNSLEGGTFRFKKEMFDAQGNLRPDAFERLAQALDGVDAAEQRRILTLIFSRRAVTGLLTLTGEQRASYEELSRATHEAGVTQDEAAEKSKGLKGQAGELKSDLADLGTEAGSLATGPLTVLISVSRDLVQGFTDFGFAVQEVGGFLGGLADKIPGGGLFGGILKDVGKVELAMHVPGLAVAKGVSAIVGHFRDGAEESKDPLDAMAKNVKSAFDQMADDLQNAADRVDSEIKRMNRSLSLGGQLAIAQATGTPEDQLAILREQQANRQADLARKRKRFAAGDVNEAAVTNAANALEETNSAIASILSEQKAKADAAASDARQKSDDILRAQEERDQALFDTINSGEARRQARIAAAGATAALGDDIKANAALRDFLRESIASVRARIGQARAAGRSAKELRAELQTLRLAKAEVRREIDRLRKERRDEADQNRVESAQLDVELAGIGADAGSDTRSQASINREVSARQRLIKALRAAQEHVKRGTLEWKRLRNQIAEEQAAIAELRKQNDKKQADTLALKRQEFDFLQTLSGFNTNLIGNVIPGMNTAGLVGGSTPNRPTTPGLGTRPAGAGTRPTAGIPTRPVTTAQGNTQISLLREIRNQLHKLNTGQAHPEAHRQRRTGSASGDFSYQGTHGM